jgi:hypothetical protein
MEILLLFLLFIAFFFCCDVWRLLSVLSDGGGEGNVERERERVKMRRKLRMKVKKGGGGCCSSHVPTQRKHYESQYI